ncbi:LrgB family protein [Alkalicoccobacillus porphyridii]|uniref:LrgB family protein n=1 Tax=Alkalicoccobacillus porphyridii TaxID=2597270 RepID=A0A554A335_9BACI|nr:LrgB family protein [Alkalicoccobacillus porphyridii]TSB48107.1 LrgB family protein [Alkalicoccobacillus porphyridii]
MIIQLTLLVGMTALTVFAYMIARWLYIRLPSPFLLPLVTSTLIVIIFIFLTGIDFELYHRGAGWLEQLIGLAVVALAFPLYKQMHILKAYTKPLLLGTAIGSLVGVVSALILASLIGLNEEIIISLLPKSVTMAVAVDLAIAAGGESSLTAILVTVAGLTGTILYPYYNLCRIHHPIGQAVGVGSASHAIGTAKALENGELEGAVSTVAMTLCAIMVSILMPLSLWVWFDLLR